MPETLSSAKWRPIVDEFLASGHTVSAWSREHGVNSRRLYYWIAKFREDSRLAEQTRWLQLQTGEPPVSDCAFEVRVGNATIVVKPGFDPEALTDIVRALEQC
ncbi:MAG: helix-turn-helix domain-containing protein [Clostridia bacterium]|nr:helix-turn-helix domain-containing protein [Clostridia bacterium]